MSVRAGAGVLAEHLRVGVVLVDALTRVGTDDEVVRSAAHVLGQRRLHRHTLDLAIRPPAEPDERQGEDREHAQYRECDPFPASAKPRATRPCGRLGAARLVDGRFDDGGWTIRDDLDVGPENRRLDVERARISRHRRGAARGEREASRRVERGRAAGRVERGERAALRRVERGERAGCAARCAGTERAGARGRPRRRARRRSPGVLLGRRRGHSRRRSGRGPWVRLGAGVRHLGHR